MVLTLTAALPSASNVSLLAERYGADNGRIARIIMASTVLAFVTFSACAWLFERVSPGRLVRRASVGILYTESTVATAMTAHLVKLQPAPDLVDRVYRALLDAISDGSLAPGERLTQEDIAAQLAVSRQPVLQALRLLKKDGLVRRRARPRRRSSRRSTPPGSPRSTRCAARSTRWPRGSPRRAAPSLDPTLIETGRRAARGHERPGDDRGRHRLPQRDLRRLRQPADRRRARACTGCTCAA